MRKKTNLTLQRKKRHRNGATAHSTMPDKRPSVSKETTNRVGEEKPLERKPGGPALKAKRTRRKITTVVAPFWTFCHLAGLPPRLKNKIENLVSELSSSGFESVLLVVKPTSDWTAQFGSKLGQNYLQEKVPHAGQDFSNFCSDEKRECTEERWPSKTDEQNEDSSRKYKHSRKSPSEIKERIDHSGPKSEDVGVQCKDMDQEHSEDDNMLESYPNTPIEDADESKHESTDSNGPTFLDFLKVEPETEPIGVSNDMLNDKEMSGDITAVPEQDHEFENLVRTVIITAEKIQEVKSELERGENGKYKCILCGRELQCKTLMTRHLDSHMKVVKQPLKKCDLCEIRLPESFMSQHRRTHNQTHPQMPTIMTCIKRDIRNDLAFCLLHDVRRGQRIHCRYCGIELNGMERFRSHFMGQHTMKYICQLCGASLYSLQQMVKHVKHHRMEQDTDNTGEQVADMPAQGDNAGLCSSQAVLAAQVTEGHVDADMVKFPCTQCKKSFISNSALKSHLKVHDKILTCKVNGCSKSFDTKSELCSHERLHTARGRTKALCSSCGHVFTCNKRLMEHMDFVHDGREPIKCEVCGSQFRSSEAHRRHMKIHTTEGKNFVCELCGEGFKTSELLCYHKRKHQDKKNYKCVRCNATFTKIASLEIHLVNHRHFSEEQPESRIKYRTCKHCGKILTNSRQLSRHIDQYHSKPKTCPYCGKQFRDRSNLRIHMQSHTNTQPRCTICNTLFRSRVKLTEHMEADHPGLRRLEIASMDRQFVQQGFDSSAVISTAQEDMVTATKVVVDECSESLIQTINKNREEVECLVASDKLISDAERFHEMNNVVLTTVDNIDSIACDTGENYGYQASQ